VFAELPVQPERAVTREDEVILGPQPHAIILGPRDPRHDDPRVLHEVVHVSAAMIVLAALEVTLPASSSITSRVRFSTRLETIRPHLPLADDHIHSKSREKFTTAVAHGPAVARYPAAKIAKVGLGRMGPRDYARYRP
jgi:hypothetical protein